MKLERLIAGLADIQTRLGDTDQGTADFNVIDAALTRLKAMPPEPDLHKYEKLHGNNFGRYRVPGGWLYERVDPPVTEEGTSTIALAFVPDPS